MNQAQKITLAIGGSAIIVVLTIGLVISIILESPDQIAPLDTAVRDAPQIESQDGLTVDSSQQGPTAPLATNTDLVSDEEEPAQTPINSSQPVSSPTVAQSPSPATVNNNQPDTTQAEPREVQPSPPEPVCDTASPESGIRQAAKDLYGWRKYESKITGCWEVKLEPGCYDIMPSFAQMIDLQFIENGQEVVRTDNERGSRGYTEYGVNRVYCFLASNPRVYVKAKSFATYPGWTISIRRQGWTAPAPEPVEPPDIAPLSGTGAGDQIVEVFTGLWRVNIEYSGNVETDYFGSSATNFILSFEDCGWSASLDVNDIKESGRYSRLLRVGDGGIFSNDHCSPGEKIVSVSHAADSAEWSITFIRQ